MLKKQAITIEFKHQVASLVLEQNYSCAQASQATAVSSSTALLMSYEFKNRR